MACLISPLAHAQQIDVPRGGHWQFNWTNRAVVIDNYLHQEDGGENIGGIISVPSLRFIRGSSRGSFDFNAEAELAAFTEGNKDNYTDYRVSAATQLDLNASHSLELIGGYRFDHDPFGLDRTEGSPFENRELDKWRQSNADIAYRYGLGTKSFFNLQVRAGAQNRDYTTNETQTRFLDRDKFTGTVLTQFTISPKSSALLEYTVQSVEYENLPPNGISRDSTYQGLLVGFNWLATAKTGGDIRIGQGTRSFDTAAREDLDRIQWRMGLNWRPRERTYLRLQTNRRFAESHRSDVAVIDYTSYRITWTEEWSRSWSTESSVDYWVYQYGSLDEDDDFVRLRSQINLELDAGFQVFLGAQYFTREAQRAGLDFEQSLGYAGFSVELN